MHSGLPLGVAAFVGREPERATVAALLAASRVVTLTGTGGCGKTRLAMEVARDVASRFPDGACWVDLQALRDPDLVATAVGEAVDVHERPGEALSETLVEQLRGRHVLLVLDNCEHLVEACTALVGALSSACPQLHVLATSRVPLVVAGEATFAVGGLPVPMPDTSSASTVRASAAARLFEVRARQVATDFRIDAGNAVAVAEICRRLDGIGAGGPVRRDPPRAFFATSVQYVADHVPDARLEAIPGAGHAAPLTHPRPLAEALTEFFASVLQQA